MNGFGLDGKLFKGLTKAGDFIILAVITVLFCVPVITIGAALTAAFYSGIKLVRDEESYVYKDFWKSFKMNFAQGFLLELIHVLIATVGLTYFSCIYFTAFIVTIPLILYVDSYIFSSIFKQLEKESVPSVQEAGTEEDTNEDKEEEE